jgi:hypothetical protein
MKIVSYIVIAFAAILLVYNATKVDFSNPFQGDSTIAFIGIVASFVRYCIDVDFFNVKNDCRQN